MYFGGLNRDQAGKKECGAVSLEVMGDAAVQHKMWGGPPDWIHIGGISVTFLSLTA
jgi:hypothetical protein